MQPVQMFSLLSALAILLLVQSLTPLCLAHLATCWPDLLSAKSLPQPPYSPLLFIYTLSMLTICVMNIVKNLRVEMPTPMLWVIHVTLASLINVFELCQDLAMVLVAGAGVAFIVSQVALMKNNKTAVKNVDNVVDNSQQCGLEALEAYQQLGNGLQPLLFMVLTLKSLYVTLTCYSMLRRVIGLYAVVERAVFASKAFLIIVYLVLVSEEAYVSIKEIPDILR